MADPSIRRDLLIDELSHGLSPVRRVRPAGWRALAWAAVALPCGLAATRIMPLYHPDWRAPGMAWAMAEIALALTLGLAVVVMAFTIGIAGRPMRGQRAVLTLGLVWLTVSLGNIAGSPWHAVHWGAGMYCYTFMMLASAPMMPLAVWALRRTRALNPARTLAVAGVGIAFLVSGLLGFCHEGRLHPADFMMHLAAGASIVILTTLLGRRLVAA